MVLAAFGAASSAFGAANTAVSGVRSLLSISNRKDPERAAAARQALERAVGGSLADAQYMLQQRSHSATAYGKQQFAIAWSELEQRNPEIAAEALKTRIATGTQSDSASVTNQLKDEWNRLIANIRGNVAESANRVLSQAGPAAASAIDSGESYSALPFSRSQMLIGVAILLAIGAVWYFSRGRR